jgi:hypothetical protein
VRSHAQKHFLKDKGPEGHLVGCSGGSSSSGGGGDGKRPRLTVPTIADLRRAIPVLGRGATCAGPSSSSTTVGYSLDDGTAADALSSLRSFASAAVAATTDASFDRAMPPPRPVLMLDQTHVLPHDDALPPPPAVNPRLEVTCSSIGVSSGLGTQCPSSKRTVLMHFMILWLCFFSKVVDDAEFSALAD